ncbi:MAG: DUF4190 domain-containing protein [Phycisphaerales bacterium]
MDPDVEPAPEWQPRRSRAPQRRLDPVAVAALIAAILLGWCPLTSIPAMVLGVVSLRRIAAQPQRLRGMGYAWSAIGIAAVLMVTTMWGASLAREYLLEELGASTSAAVTAVLTKGPDDNVWVQVGAGGPSPEEAAAFQEQVEALIGPVREVRVNNLRPEGIMAATWEAAFTVDGEKAVAFGTAQFAQATDFQPGRPMFPPPLFMRSILLDVGGKRISLPPGACEPKP